MEQKILENFRNRVGHLIQNPNPTPHRNLAQIEINPVPSTSRANRDLVEAQNNPIPSTSRANSDLSEAQINPVPSTSRANQDSNETFQNFPINFSDSLKVYENDQIQVYIEKAIHQRHKQFRLQDFLYNVKIKVKDSSKKPLLKDLLDVLEKALCFILNTIRSNFKPEDHNVVYVDLFQSPMVNALNSGGFLLQDKSNEVVERLLSILNQFLISENNLNLEINDTLKIFITIFSVDHVNYKNQRARLPQENRRKKKHYGSKVGQNHKFRWCIDIPNGCEGHPTLFQNKCFLICIILGILQNAYFKSDQQDMRFVYAQGINYGSTKKQTYAGKILKIELEKIITNLSLDANGPYDFKDVALKASAFYQCQIFVFGGMENSTKLKYVIPNEIDDNLMPIYLYEPFNENNHVIFIKNLQGYFRANKKICFVCLKTFKSHRYLHRCVRTLTCFACRRKFSTSSTYLHVKLKENYCDSKTNINTQSVLCNICNCVLKTKHCQKGHKKICNGKGQFGYKCLKCKKFTYRRDNDTSESIKQTHKCGTVRCRFCSNYYNEELNENIHLCLLKKESIPAHWPTLCFMKVSFQDLAEEHCTDCFDKKKHFAKENNVSLKEVFKQKNHADCLCEHHFNKNTVLDPNLIIMYKEDCLKRGIFSKQILSKYIAVECENNALIFDYLSEIKGPSTFVQRHKKYSEDISIITKILKHSKDENLSVIKLFFKTIFCNAEWFNTTFVLQDEDSITLVSFKM